MRAHVNSPAYVLTFAAVSSLLLTGAIMTLHAVTEPIARRNARLSEQRAIVEVFALGSGLKLTDERILAAYRDHVRPLTQRLADPRTGSVFNDPSGAEGAPRTLAAVRKDPQTGREQVLGYAFPVWGVGFWARIDGYLAVTPDLKRILGVTFLRHSETPGLGGRITEKAWRARFQGLDIAPTPAGGPVLFIGGEKPAGPDSPRRGRYVDAITGATGTSTAVATFLNRRIAEFRRAAQAARLAEKGGPADG